MSERPSLMIVIAGPYRSGTGDDPEKLAENVRQMESHALPLFRAGHLPIVGEWLALPLCALAGSERIGDAAFEEIFHPIAERLLARCDAVLRVGGASAGADLMVRVAEQRGLRVYHDAGEIPGCDASPPPPSAAERASAAALLELSEPLQSLLTELGATAAAPAVLAYATTWGNSLRAPSPYTRAKHADTFVELSQALGPYGADALLRVLSVLGRSS